MKQGFDPGMLDQAIEATLQAIQSGKEQVNGIAENAKSEKTLLLAESIATKAEVEAVILEVDRLEVAYRKAKNQLVLVSQNFSPSSELSIKEAYHLANQLQIDLLLARERENRLKARRDELIRRLRTIEDTIARADSLITQLSTVLTYLSGDLKQLGSMLKTAEQRHLLGVQMIRVQEEERRRVAREIHDGPAQAMANVVLRAEICERMLDRDLNLDLVRMELQELKKSVRESLTEVRGIISNLRPMALDDLGLIPALRKYTEGLQNRAQIPIELRVFGVERRLNSSAQVALFRIFQESLSNACKHSRATSIKVRVEHLENGITLQVLDDGIGFQMGDQLVIDGEHFGLLGMQERVALFGGKLEIKSKLGQGTKITVTLPLIEEEGS